jgi:zinc transporter ZupT
MVLPFPYNAPLRALCLLLALCAEPAYAQRADDAYEEIHWDRLLPESLRGENFFGNLDAGALSDDDPAAAAALAAYREKWKDAPPNPAMRDSYVKIRGFVVPLEWERESALTEFLLVPYFGACIHTPPPPRNQIIHVVPDSPIEGIRSMDAVLVYGKLHVENSMSAMGDAVYGMRADKVEPYGADAPEHFIPAAAITVLCGLSVWLGCAAARIRKTIPALFFAYGIGFSAGILSCLGLSSVLVKPSVPALCIFLASALGTACMLRFLHRDARRDARDEISGRHMRHTGKCTALAIAAHNVPECFVVFGAAAAEPLLGLALGGAMIAHTVPLGIAVACPDDAASPAPRPHMYVLLAGLFPPVAAILLHECARSLFSPAFLEQIFAGSGGIMAAVAATELMPSAAHCGGRYAALRGWCAGALFMLCITALVYAGR